MINIQKEFIFDIKETLYDAFIGGSYFDITIQTKLYKYTIGKFEFIRTKSYYPKFHSYYDGDFNTKNKIKAIISLQKQKLKSKYEDYINE
ncbi:MAG: hypothetical protein J1F35_06515 [Erysipelotrichales bacterium]|nr:hypothetical protein [Erysipelotrichales bacterium]